MQDRPVDGITERMRSPLHARLLRGPPLALQIVGLLVAGLVVAQIATLFLTLVLPPTPRAQYSLATIATMLRDGTDKGGSNLVRRIQAGPPDTSGPGWLTSDRSRHELAGLLDADDGNVLLSFYTPLPFAGTATLPVRLAQADPDVEAQPEPVAYEAAPISPARFIQANYIVYAQAAAPRGGFPGRGLPGGGFPGGGLPGAGLPGGNFPGGGFPGRGTSGGFPGTSFPSDGFPTDRASPRNLPQPDQSPFPQEERRQPLPGQDIPRDSGSTAQLPDLPSAPSPSVPDATDRGAALPQRAPSTPRAPSDARPSASMPGLPKRGAPPPLLRRPPSAPHGPILIPQIDVPLSSPSEQPVPAPVPSSPSPSTRHAPPPATAPTIAKAGAAIPAAPPLAGDGAPGENHERAQTPRSAARPVEQSSPIPIEQHPSGLFGLAPAPFVEGDFVAALRLADGRWAVVQPMVEAFPNSWQRRVLLWFAIAFAIVAPLGWMFARRIFKPLRHFAHAAEQLGRDPGAAVLPLDGPAEVGRAANAFNLMQSRLRAFVDDRTAMISAISHDLRTPLTRLRFQIEDVADQSLRDGMIEEVADMQAMITSVLDFLREASTPGTREKIDLGSIVDEAVEDAIMIGQPVKIEQRAVAPVEVDVVGMRRVIDNLLGNAVKYGDKARVRISVEDDNAIAEILDSGPGLPEHEFEDVFAPFYRSANACDSDKPGTGLGLAVCRSIARAHGGEILLSNAAEGLSARVVIPLAFDQKRLLAA